jgi:multiple sugar transport system substrate-binding protein
VPLPRVPEWEQITTKIMQEGQLAIAGQITIDDALATLNREVNGLLDKRRWMLARHDSQHE